MFLRLARIACPVLTAAACSEPPPIRAEAWPEAEALFHQDPRWLGADAALSVDLGGDRILWLFGDTFVAKGEPKTRRNATMVRNSIAIQHGRDVLQAQMSMHWRLGPTSFFPEDGEHWYWPAPGFKIAPGGALVLFMLRIRATPGKGLGFAGAGYRIVVVANPDQAPEQWQMRWLEPTAPAFDAVLGSAVVQEGEHVVAVAIRERGVHEGYLARFLVSDLAGGIATKPEWWQAGRWVEQKSLRGLPSVVLADAGAECSLHYDAHRGRYLHVMSRGFGATTLAVSESERLTGPWSMPRDVYVPPESRGTKPFVYAGKAHPELATSDAGGLLATYATNSFEFADLFSARGERELYWPRCVRLHLR